jgi:hypothetical protein
LNAAAGDSAAASNFTTAKFEPKDLVSTAPVDEGGFGHIQFGGDAGEGPALGAEADESFDDLGESGLRTQGGKVYFFYIIQV